MHEDRIERARVAFFEGVVHFEAQRLPQAHAAFERAYALTPQRPSVLLNLGVTRVRLARYADAVPLLAQAVQAEPQSPDGWAALAVAYFELSQWHMAAPAFERAIEQATEQSSEQATEQASEKTNELANRLAIKPATRSGVELVPMQLQYARCLVRLNRTDDAVAAYRRVLTADGQNVEAWYQLGDLLRDQRQIEHAVHSYRQALAYGADEQLIHYILSALGAQAPILRPPRLYVQGLFDQYAADFDEHLLGQLAYQGHSALIEQFPVGALAHFDRVLDLGCGTGLCGALLRHRADWLEGVDLSPAMIAKAALSHHYDRLNTDDIHDYLQADPSSWNWVLAADVFIYVGELDRLFALLAQRLRIGGWLSFTVEASANADGVQLLPSLRYAHSKAYLEALALQHGFGVVRVTDAPIRFDQGQPVMGQYWHLRNGY